MVEEYGITIVPLSVMVDGVLYLTELGEGDSSCYLAKSPKTGQPPVGVFAEIYEKLAADGAHIVSIHNFMPVKNRRGGSPLSLSGRCDRDW